MSEAFTEAQLAFLAQLDKLPDGLDLTPEQAGLVLAVDAEWLRKKRQQSEGAGPPFRQLGDGEGERKKPLVRYPLGLLRKWQAERVYGNTRLAKKGIVGDFASFLAEGMPTDTHLFTLDGYGRPLPFNGDGAPISLNLFQYADRLKEGAQSAFAHKEEKEISPPPLPPSARETP